MKRFLILLISVAMALSLVGCSRTHYVSSYKAAGFVHSNSSSSAHMRFVSFDGKMVFHLKGVEGGSLNCTAKLESGNASFYYDDNGAKTPLLTISDGQKVQAEIASLEAGKVYVIVETDGKCTNGNFEFKVEK